jgi:hypothetical protein
VSANQKRRLREELSKAESEFRKCDRELERVLQIDSGAPYDTPEGRKENIEQFDRSIAAATELIRAGDKVLEMKFQLTDATVIPIVRSIDKRQISKEWIKLRRQHEVGIQQLTVMKMSLTHE